MSDDFARSQMKFKIWRVQFKDGREATYYSACAMTPDEIVVHIPLTFVGHRMEKIRPIDGEQWRNYDDRKKCEVR